MGCCNGRNNDGVEEFFAGRCCCGCVAKYRKARLSTSVGIAVEIQVLEGLSCFVVHMMMLRHWNETKV